MTGVAAERDEIFVDYTKRSGEGVFVVRICDALHDRQGRASAPDTIALISANEGYVPLELPRRRNSNLRSVQQIAH